MNIPPVQIKPGEVLAFSVSGDLLIVQATTARTWAHTAVKSALAERRPQAVAAMIRTDLDMAAQTQWGRRGAK